MSCIARVARPVRTQLMSNAPPSYHAPTAASPHISGFLLENFIGSRTVPVLCSRLTEKWHQCSSHTFQACRSSILSLHAVSTAAEMRPMVTAGSSRSTPTTVSSFVGAHAKHSVRAARSSVSHVSDFLRLPTLRSGAGVANAWQVAISDESMLSTSCFDLFT